MQVLPAELLHVGVEEEFHIKGPLETRVEYFVTKFGSEQVLVLLQFLFEPLSFQHSLVRTELIPTHSFKCLQVVEVDILLQVLLKPIDETRFIVTVKTALLHLQLLLQSLVPDLQQGIPGLIPHQLNSMLLRFLLLLLWVMTVHNHCVIQGPVVFLEVVCQFLHRPHLEKLSLGIAERVKLLSESLVQISWLYLGYRVA